MGKDMKKKKRLSREDKKNITRCSVLLMASLVNLTVASLAWFTNNKNSEFKEIQLNTGEEKFELASCAQRGIYDDKLVYVNDIVDKDDDTSVLSTGIPQAYGDGQVLFRTDSEIGRSEISWMMTEENNIQNMSELSEGVGPDQSGKLSFYVIPKQDGDLTVNFTLDFTFYSDDAAPGEQAVMIGKKYFYPIETQSDLYKLIKGHLLFFENMEDGRYSDRIIDYSTHALQFSRTFTDARKDMPEQVDIYWTWPYVVGMAILPDGHKNLGNYESIFEPESIDSENGDRSLFMKDMTENIGYYLSNTENYENLKEAIENNTLHDNVIAMSEGGSMSLFSELSASWNKADQRLGIGTDGMKLTLTARSG